MWNQQKSFKSLSISLKCTCADAQNQFFKIRFLVHFMLQCNKDKIWITEKLLNYTLALENKIMKVLMKMNGR